MTRLAMSDLGDELPLPRPASRGEATEFLQFAFAYEGDTCLFWPFSLKPNGYASIGSRKGKMYVHRAVCLEVNGPPPTAKHEAAHSCGNRSCVNPRHLRWATHRQNHADRIVHGTSNRGELNGNAILTSEKVVLARELAARGVPIKIIANQGMVAPATIAKAVRGRTWGWLS